MDYFAKSGRKSFGKLLLIGLGYMLLANVLCTIMTISTAAFIGEDFIKVIVVILAFIIFYSLMFTVGYKDGDREQKLVHLKKADPPDEHRWIKLGILLALIMFIPSIVLLIDKISGMYYDVLLVYRIIDGLVYALSLLLIPENSIDAMNIAVPFVFMLCYALIPVATHLGYYFGYTQKFDKDKLMYN